MHQTIESINAFFFAATSAFLGNRVFAYIGDVATSQDGPQWIATLLGPLGALGAMIIAIYWLQGRLNKVEEKADKRDDERDADRKTLITVLTQNTTALEQNSTILKDVKMAVERNHPSH
jgi:hypothetical protein